MSITSGRPSELVSILKTDFINGQVPIEQVTLTGNQTTIEIDDIPDTFRTLILVTQLRTDYASGIDFAYLRFNSDSSQVYDQLRITFSTGESDGIGTWVNRASSQINCLATEAIGSLSSSFGPGIVWIPGYKLDDRNKRVIALSGAFGPLSVGTDIYADLTVGNWRDTDAIATVTLLPRSGNNFVSGSKVDLYGVV